MPNSISDTLIYPNIGNGLKTAKRLPTFIGIGVQRAGTTWFYECLNQHPEIFMPSQKELGYFGGQRERDLNWYHQQFLHGSKAKALGEITPTYILERRAIEQMLATVPTAKLFVVLREPFSRAYSAFQLFKQKRWANMTFAQAAQRDSDLVRYGLYADQLEALYEYFPPSQVHVILYDDVLAKPQAVLAQLFDFIEVDPTFHPPACTQRYNRVIMPKMQANLYKVGLGQLVDAVKATPIGPWIKRVHARTGKDACDTLGTRDRKRIASYFAADIDRVEQIIERDLSAWRQVAT